MGSTDRREIPGTETLSDLPENSDDERECSSISILALRVKLAEREAALLEGQRRADQLAAALDKTQSELAAARARVENAEETIAAVSEIAEAAQATIDKLRAEIAGAEAEASEAHRHRHGLAAERSRGLSQHAPLKARPRGHLGRKLISLLPLPFGLRTPRLSLKRGRPSPITLADRARDAGQWELAGRYYRKALNRNPRNSPIWVQYGHTLKERGHMSDAEGAYRKAIEIDPNSADAHLQLGHILKLQRRRNEALSAYLRALELDPTLRAASLELVALGWTRASLSRFNPRSR
jgi:tetratricopeptide (TPR) repeat protein